MRILVKALLLFFFPQNSFIHTSNCCFIIYLLFLYYFFLLRNKTKIVQLVNGYFLIFNLRSFFFVYMKIKHYILYSIHQFHIYRDFVMGGWVEKLYKN